MQYYQSWNPAYVDHGTDWEMEAFADERDELLRLGAIQAAIGNHDDADDLADEVHELELEWREAHPDRELRDPETGLCYDSWVWG